jgi:formylglycine-generating enzyme required for sulfatase activity
MKSTYSALLLILLLCSCGGDQTKNQIDWVLVEGGIFMQGENQYFMNTRGDTVRNFTSPKREVTLNDFYISKYEVTVREFKEFCKQTNRIMPEHPSKRAIGGDGNTNWNDDDPMIATWNEAEEFANWKGGRLPTEAEWEYAAKGGNKSKGYIYSGSDTANEVGWVKENANGSYHAKGMLKSNELGIYDMTGNVSEWVSDWYYPNLDVLNKVTNPKGPNLGIDQMKISKGVGRFYGSVNENTGLPIKFSIHIPEVRFQSPILTRSDGFGFRIAKDK